MRLSRRVQLQLAFFAVITLLAGGVMAFGYLDVGNLLFGIGHYRVTVDLPAAGGLYPNGNVTYRGVTVGRINGVQLTPSGVTAVLSMDSGIHVPANLDAHVHSQTAVGEQFIDLVPRSGNGPSLKDGDIITADRTTIPPDINSLLAATNTGLLAIPHGNLKTVIDEANTAVGGLGPELSRIIQGYNRLAADARTNLEALTTVIDKSGPVLDTQTDTSDSIQAWAANLDQITAELQENDGAVGGILDKGPAAAEQARQLLDRLRPTLPILLANLVTIDRVAITYQPNLEQLLVLLPPAIGSIQGSLLADRDTKQAYNGIYLSFNINVDIPPPCTTGFLPAQQARVPSEVDYPDRPAGDLYCRVPQDSNLVVRGARNLPCETRPGKRAPTVKMCESNEEYIPLNDGYNWKGDPNATLSGQPVPQLPPHAATPPSSAPMAITHYDPATGNYIGPDGRQYTQGNLAGDTPQPRRWQDLLVPPKGN